MAGLKGVERVKHLAATTVTTALQLELVHWNGFGYITLGRCICRVWELICLTFIRVKNLFDGKAGLFGRMEPQQARHFIGIEALFLLLSHGCFGDEEPNPSCS